MNQYDRIYTLMSEMVWTQKGQEVGPQKLNPVILSRVTRGRHGGGGKGSEQRKTVKTLASMARNIEDINVSPKKTDLDKWNAAARKVLRRLGQRPGDVAVASHEQGPASPHEQGPASPGAGKRPRGTPRVLRPGVAGPKPGEGKPAGRKPEK